MSTGIKIVTLGESMTGKTSICLRLVCNDFVDNTESTIGASYMILKVDDIKYEIWDTAGQERFLCLSSLYYRGSDIILMTYDLSNIATIERTFMYLDKVINEIQNRNYKIIFVGNKSDLVTDEIINKSKKKIAKRIDKYESIKDKISNITISAKTSHNFDQLLNIITDYGKTIIKLKDSEPIKDIIQLSNNTNWGNWMPKMNINPRNCTC
jgi:small GTP-binding protein